jgi:hypothetical protein
LGRGAALIHGDGVGEGRNISLGGTIRKVCSFRRRSSNNSIQLVYEEKEKESNKSQDSEEERIEIFVNLSSIKLL